MFTILFPDLLRPLTERELIDLRKSIRRRGVAVPIIVDEEDGGVIDGGNRLRHLCGIEADHDSHGGLPNAHPGRKKGAGVVA